MSAPRQRNLICSCCGGYAGRWQQHSNRDTGYGLCTSCRDWIWNKSHVEERREFERTYGKPGINYEAWPEGHEATKTDPITSYYTDRATGAHAAKAP